MMFLSFYLFTSVPKRPADESSEIFIGKVKESCKRPGVAQRVPGGLGSQIS
jgi:hypothetical protein